MIFDYIDNIKNLKLGIDAAGSVDGFEEVTLFYMVGVLEPNKGKYDI